MDILAFVAAIFLCFFSFSCGYSFGELLRYEKQERAFYEKIKAMIEASEKGGDVER